MEPQKKSLLLNSQSITHTVAQLKGRRLRMVRALTGFSRQELYEKIGIATSTIDTWESGRVELSEKSAARVCEAFRKVGIHCASEWLLTGAGSPPRLMKDVEKSIFVSKDMGTFKEEVILNDYLFQMPPFLDEDIRQELSFFMSIHKNALFHVVEDDFMNSRYKKSDCVAGEVVNLQYLEGRIVIAQLVDRKTILCKLLRSLGEECKVFLGKNISNKEVKILKAAEVVWHRKSKRKQVWSASLSSDCNI
ncbi:MAG: helix-turn-helix transcriptional regulator [Holosporaceae bacterium]|nr:helix-turn-helix transcriptional regulator [Holosporaceae bacterium]